MALKLTELVNKTINTKRFGLFQKGVFEIRIEHGKYYWYNVNTKKMAGQLSKNEIKRLWYGKIYSS